MEYGQFAPFEQMSAEDFQAVVDTCFYGVVYTTRAAIPVMRKQRSGHLFQVSSVGGRIAIAGNTPYHAAKWAVGGFSDSLAMEVAPFGIKVCTLEPGGIRTNWARRAVQNAPDLLPEYEATVGSSLRMLRGLEGRWESDPRKIADVILRLANSDEVPVRLILGVDAEKRVQQAEAARAAEADNKLERAIRRGVVRRFIGLDWISDAVAKDIISDDEAQLLREADGLTERITAVDDFDPDEILPNYMRPGHNVSQR